MSSTVLGVLHEYDLIPTILYSGYYPSLQMRKLRLLRVSNFFKVTQLVNGEVGTQIPVFLTLKILDALEKTNTSYGEEMLIKLVEIIYISI